MGAWILGVFFFLLARPTTWLGFILLIFLAYGVALAPLQYLQNQERRESGRRGSIPLTFFAQLASVALVSFSLQGGLSRNLAAKVFILFLGVGVAVQMVFAYLDLDQMMSDGQIRTGAPTGAVMRAGRGLS
jgi:hypothetical protein